MAFTEVLRRERLIPSVNSNDRGDSNTGFHLWGAYPVPGSVLSALVHLVLTTALQDRGSYYDHFTAKKTRQIEVNTITWSRH